MRKLPILSPSPCMADLDEVRSRLSPEQLQDVRTKVNAIAGTIIFASYENKLLAERMLEYGVLMGFIDVREGEAMESKVVGAYGNMRIEQFPHPFFDGGAYLISQGVVLCNAPLCSGEIHMALAREIGSYDSVLKEMMLKCQFICNEKIPRGELHFMVADKIVYKITGIEEQLQQ